MSNFQLGQRVHVEFDGKIDHAWHLGAKGVYVAPDGLQFSAWVPVANTTPLDPENWPPQVGDIWEADSEEYFVRENRSSDLRGTIVVDRFATVGRVLGHTYTESRLNGIANLNNFKSLSPTLVRRRGQ